MTVVEIAQVVLGIPIRFGGEVRGFGSRSSQNVNGRRLLLNEVPMRSVNDVINGGASIDILQSVTGPAESDDVAVFIFVAVCDFGGRS